MLTVPTVLELPLKRQFPFIPTTVFGLLLCLLVDKGESIGQLGWCRNQVIRQKQGTVIGPIRRPLHMADNPSIFLEGISAAQVNAGESPGQASLV